jgi:hypothetical protein
MAQHSGEFGFASREDTPLPYLERTRTYYEALGYGAPYQWAHYADVPFHPLGKPLTQARIAIITTAAPYQPDKGNQGPRAPYNAAAKFYAVYSGMLRRITTCASPMSPSTETTPLRRTRVLISRWPNCAKARLAAASAPWRPASTACRRTAAIG